MERINRMRARANAQLAIRATAPAMFRPDRIGASVRRIVAAGRNPCSEEQVALMTHRR